MATDAVSTRGATDAVPASLKAAGFVAAAAWLVVAWIAITNPSFDGHLDSTTEYVNDIAFTVALLATALTAEALFVIGRPKVVPVRLVQVGYVLVSVGVIAGLLAGDDPEWFPVVGMPGNLLAIVGMVWLGVHGIRRGSLPRGIAWLAIPTGLLSVLFAELGTPVLAVVFWVLVVTRAPARD